MPRSIVLICAALGALLVLWMGASLPPTVASHFGSSGTPDARMPKGAFIALCASMVAALPVVVWWFQTRAAARGKAAVPHAAHWFSTDRCDRTRRFLQAHAAWFAVALCAFLCWNFWLVVRAHPATGGPGALSMSAFFAGLLVFGLFTGIWVVALYVRFHHADA
jgi:uncharacterized membrane protein